MATELEEQPEKAGGWLPPSEEFVAVSVEQRARAVVPPGPQEGVALPEAVVAELEGQPEAVAEPSVEVAAPVGAEKVEEPSVEVVDRKSVV